MQTFTYRLLLLLTVFLVCHNLKACKTKQKVTGISVKLGKLPNIELKETPSITPELDKRIRELIASLAFLDKPDFGLSATLSGHDFAPIPGQSQAGSFLITDHQIKPSEAVKALVKLGPDALPFLLDALDDQTPTKITITHSYGFGGMWHASELWFNMVNPTEKVTFEARLHQPRDEEINITSYTVKVGDVCFVVIGQIVGRNYQAMRYQPTACVVVNSPTFDKRFCAEVREIWQSKNARKKLFKSLLADYATEGVFNGHSLDGWGLGSSFQCGAAMRLLYYYPKESFALIAKRLDKLNVGIDKGPDDFMHRCVANGVVAENFVGAVAWSQEPKVQLALKKLFVRANDINALLAALPAVKDTYIIGSRLKPLIVALPTKEDGPYGHGYHLLSALCKRTPDIARPIFELYLRDANAQRCHTVCLVLREIKMDWSTDVLIPLLVDKRTWGWNYAVEAGKNEPRLPIRVCDEAVITLCQHNSNLQFSQVGDHIELDKQIDAVREYLAKKK